MNQSASFLPGIVALGGVLFISIVLASARPRLDPAIRRSRRFAIVVGLTILAQGIHFLEELRAGFYVTFPGVFGLPPFSRMLFVAFNGTWLAIWVVALLAVRRGFSIATFALWFLGLAMVLNLIAHPILALRAGGYFAGLYTAPLVGLFGVLTLGELARVTAADLD